MLGKMKEKEAKGILLKDRVIDTAFGRHSFAGEAQSG